jgi:hypothetical protein
MKTPVMTGNGAYPYLFKGDGWYLPRDCAFSTRAARFMRLI